MLQPEIITLKGKKLVGLSLRMSLSQNRTADLWRSFMPLRNTVPNTIHPDLLYSLQVYDPDYFSAFSHEREFLKWALVEVSDHEQIPVGMSAFNLEEGTYAVFHYNGPANDPAIFLRIFTEWLPASGYRLDHRPHFEVLGPRYSNVAADSEEEIWIPVVR